MNNKQSNFKAQRQCLFFRSNIFHHRVDKNRQNGFILTQSAAPIVVPVTLKGNTSGIALNGGLGLGGAGGGIADETRLPLDHERI